MGQWESTIGAWGRLGGRIVLGKIFPDRQPMNVREKQIANALGWLAGLAVIASFALMILPIAIRSQGKA